MALDTPTQANDLIAPLAGGAFDHVPWLATAITLFYGVWIWNYAPHSLFGERIGNPCLIAN